MAETEVEDPDEPQRAENLGKESCALCKPGQLLRETIPGHYELGRAWADRGGA